MQENPQKFKDEFWSQVSADNQVAELFEYLPEIYFWAKNEKRQYVHLNQQDAEKCGGSCEADILGKTDFDIFPSELAENFDKDDLYVLTTGNKIVDRVELVPNADGTVDWYSTTKVPIYSKDKKIIGVAGTTRNLKKASGILQPYMDMNHVVDYISKNYSRPIEVSTLAKMAALSVSQFERKFKKMFQISPLKFIIKVRIKAACRLLAQSRDHISNIALATGFYDQSDFSRQFRANMGVSPREYRRRVAHQGREAKT